MRTLTIPEPVQVGNEQVPFLRVMEAALNGPEWRGSVASLREALRLLDTLEKLQPGEQLELTDAQAFRLARWVRRPSYDTPQGPQQGFPWPTAAARQLVPHLEVLEQLATEAECLGAPLGVAGPLTR